MRELRTLKLECNEHQGRGKRRYQKRNPKTEIHTQLYCQENRETEREGERAIIYSLSKYGKQVTLREVEGKAAHIDIGRVLVLGMPGTLIRDTRGLLPRCNLLCVLHLRQRIHGPCTLPISQFPVLPSSPNPTAPQTACSSSPASSSRINCRESLQLQCNHKTLGTAVCNDTRFLLFLR